jgi:hypothetical protein
MRSIQFGHRAPLVVVAALAIGLHGDAGAQDRKAALLLTNVRIFDVAGGRFAEPQDLLIRDGQIAQVGAVTRADADALRIDTGGAYALPGLWDSHVHLSWLTLSGGDTLAATLDSMARHGVLYVRDVGGPLDVIAAIARRTANGELRGPTIFFGGPMAERPPLYWAQYNTMLPGITVPIESERDVDELVTKISDAGGSFVKAFGKWDRQLFRLLRSRAMDRSLGVVVDPGTPLFQDLPVDTLLAIGVASIEHAHSPWLSLLRADLRERHDSIAASGVDPSQRGPFAFEVISLGSRSFQDGQLSRLGELWKRTGIFFCPTLRVSENRRKSLPPIPSANSEEERSRFWNGWADASVAVTRSLASQGVPLLIGQDDIDPMATFEEMELLARIGVPPADIIRAATLNPARSLRRDADLGSIQTGKVGDLVLFRGNPLENMAHIRSPWLVVRRGEVILKRD